MHWLIHLRGIDPQSSWAYDAWSGCSPALLTSTTITAGILTFARRRNCEVRGCWRLGRHQTAAGHLVCRRHHPAGHLTAQDVRAAHEEARNR